MLQGGTTVHYDGEWLPNNWVHIGFYEPGSGHWDIWEGYSPTEPQKWDIPWYGNWSLYIQNDGSTTIDFLIKYWIDQGK